LSESSDSSEKYNRILTRICEYSDAESGILLVAEDILAENPDSRKIEAIAEKNMLKTPTYLTKYIEEVRDGRRSTGYEKAFVQKQPFIIENIETNDAIEAKLILRLGFKALVIIPVRLKNKSIGLIVLFASSPFHFKKENLDIFKTISSQIGIALHNSALQKKLIIEAQFTAVGEVVSSIGGDIKQVLQGLETSQFLVNKALHERSLERIETGWMMTSRQIWQLSQVTLNILDFSRPDPQLFFPDDINKLILSCIDQINSLPFSGRIEIGFNGDPNIGEVFVNRIVISRILLNLASLSIDSCWDASTPKIQISTKLIPDPIEKYRVVFACNGFNLPEVEYSEVIKPDYIQSGIRGMGLLLTCVQNSVDSHNGQLYFDQLLETELFHCFRIEIPRFPTEM